MGIIQIKRQYSAQDRARFAALFAPEALMEQANYAPQEARNRSQQSLDDAALDTAVN